MAVGTLEHMHHKEQGHGGLTFLSVVATLARSITALLMAISNTSDATSEELAASALDIRMAETPSLRILQQLGPDMNRLQGGIPQSMPSSEAIVIQSNILSTLSPTKTLIQANLMLIKIQVGSVANTTRGSTRDIAVDQAKVAAH